MKKNILFSCLLVISILAITNSYAQTVQDGPVRYAFRVTEIGSETGDDIWPNADEFVTYTWVRDYNNYDGQDFVYTGGWTWTNGAWALAPGNWFCGASYLYDGYTASVSASPYAFSIGSINVSSANNQPTHWQVRMEGWEDDCFSCSGGFACLGSCSSGSPAPDRATYNANCGCGCDCSNDDQYVYYTQSNSATTGSVGCAELYTRIKRTFDPPYDWHNRGWLASFMNDATNQGYANNDNDIGFAYEQFRTSSCPNTLTASATTVCPNTVVTLNWSSQGNGGSFLGSTTDGLYGGVYELYRTDGTLIYTGTATSTTVLLTTPGTYTYRVYIRNGGSSGWAFANSTTRKDENGSNPNHRYSYGYREVTITVETPSVAPTSITASTDTSCSGDAVTLTANGGTVGTGASYQWFSGSCGGTSIAGSGASITVNPTANTTYYVRLSGNCNTTSCVSVDIAVNPYPDNTLVPVLASSSVCQDSSSLVQISNSQSGFTYQLRENGGNINIGGPVVGNGGTITLPTGNLTSTTTFNVLVTGSAPTFCQAQLSATVTVTVNQPPVVSLTVTPNDTICFGSFAVFTASGASLYEFFVDGVSVQSLGTDDTYSTNSLADSQVVTVTGVDTNGCPNTASGITITVNPLPIVTLNTFNDICVDSATFSLNGGSPAGGIYSGPGVSVDSLSASAAGAGTHSITYTYTDSNGCTDSASQSITINPLPVVSLSLTDVCINDTSFALSGGSPASGGVGIYSGTGVSANNFDPAAATVGSHNITYAFTDANGCTNSANDSITVFPQPLVSLAAFNDVCEDEPVFALTGGTPNSGGVGVYSGTGVLLGNFNASNAATGNNLITYTFTDGNGCSNFDTASITVNSLPIVTFTPINDVCLYTPAFGITGGNPAGGTYSGTGVFGGVFDPAQAGGGIHNITYTYTDLNGCTNDSMVSLLVDNIVNADFSVTPVFGYAPFDATFTNNSSGANSFLWYFGTGDSSLLVNPVYTYSDTGKFTVMLLAVAANGCIDTAIYTFVKVNESSSLIIPNVFSPNGDGNNDIFKVKGVEIKSIKGEIFNRWGQRIFEWDSPKKGWEGKSYTGLDAPEGIYYYKISAEGNDGIVYPEQSGTVTLVR